MLIHQVVLMGHAHSSGGVDGTCSLIRVVLMGHAH